MELEEQESSDQDMAALASPSSHQIIGIIDKDDDKKASSMTMIEAVLGNLTADDIAIAFRVFSLETRSLNSEAYKFIDAVDKHYNEGLFSFYAGATSQRKDGCPETAAKNITVTVPMCS